MPRLMVMRLVPAFLLVMLAGCTTSPEVSYFVSYVDAAAYEGDAEDAALDRCAALDGADRAGQADSLPPSVTLTFSGSREEREAFEDCLRSLTNVRIIGPAEDGDPSPPLLVA